LGGPYALGESGDRAAPHDKYSTQDAQREALRPRG
jgi:hypothetical protein